MQNPDLDQVRTREALLAASLPHVVFDGWSEAAFQAALADLGLEPGLARLICPRGAVDLAVAYHREGDAAMVARIAAADLGRMRFRDRVTAAVRWRIEGADREVVRRGTTLFAQPAHLALGAGLIWETADAIWRALGDGSADINWYTKRVLLSGVYSATALYWLGDDSAGQDATWAFLDRRIGDVMRIEEAKAKLRENKPLMRLLAGPLWLAAQVKAPGARQAPWSGPKGFGPKGFGPKGSGQKG